jgi:hypothetical protein
MNGNARARGRRRYLFILQSLLRFFVGASRMAPAAPSAVIAAIAIAAVPLAASAQEEEPQAQEEQPQAEEGPQANVVATPIRLELIDMPTAQTLPRGAYEFGLHLMSGGCAVAGGRVGMIDAFTFGFHYGGSEILASGDPDWNPRVEFYAKLRLLRETTVPGIAIGYDSQGLGRYDEDLDRYEIKSRGFYAAMDKTWPVGGFLSLHGGMSYSLEDEDEDNSPTFWVGMQKSIGNPVTLLIEYDLALNDDNDDGQYGRGKGYLNSALAWAITDAFSLEFALRNMTENTYDDGLLGDWNREVRLRYAEFF